MRTAEKGVTGGREVEECYVPEYMRDATAIPSFERVEQADGTVCYFFADTCIRVRELQEDGKMRLEPISGDQVACGEWVDLPLDRVHGYCFLLEKFLKGGENS